MSVTKLRRSFCPGKHGRRSNIVCYFLASVLLYVFFSFRSNKNIIILAFIYHLPLESCYQPGELLRCFCNVTFQREWFSESSRCTRVGMGPETLAAVTKAYPFANKKKLILLPIKINKKAYPCQLDLVIF